VTRQPGGSPLPPSPEPKRIERVARRPRSRVNVAALGVALLVPLALLLGAAFMFGWKFQPMETQSMAPHFPAGSLAVVEPIDATEVEPGMTIVFADPQGRDRLVAHRAVTQLPGTPPVWQTKGDANAEPDPIPVQASAIQGRVVWAIPVLGHVVIALRGPQAVVLLVALPLATLLFTEFRAWRRRDHARAQDAA
jgi:signal peptidase